MGAELERLMNAMKYNIYDFYFVKGVKADHTEINRILRPRVPCTIVENLKYSNAGAQPVGTPSARRGGAEDVSTAEVEQKYISFSQGTRPGFSQNLLVPHGCKQ